MPELTGKERFTFSEMETALCLWEAYIDRENADETFMKDARGNVGSYAMRQAIMSITREIEKLWESLDDDIKDGWTHDFEFCPDVISHAIDWSTLTADGYVALFPDAKERLLAHRVIEDKFAG